MRQRIKVLSLFLILSLLLTSNCFAIGKRVISENKYIWIYVNGERKLIPEDSGYPCYGQGTDNKNILYVPLNVVANIAGYKVSSIKKVTESKDSYKLYVTVSGIKEFTITLGDTNVGDIKLAGAPFILKGSEKNNNNVIMVPLGFVKDGFGLDIEVQRPIGRGVYDYCSLAINFTGEINENNDEVIDVPNPDGDKEAADGASNDYYYVNATDDNGVYYYHKYTCEKKQANASRLTEFECKFWGYVPCPICFGEE